MPLRIDGETADHVHLRLTCDVCCGAETFVLPRDLGRWVADKPNRQRRLAGWRERQAQHDGREFLCPACATQRKLPETLADSMISKLDTILTSAGRRRNDC
jgi:hypothetical protein